MAFYPAHCDEKCGDCEKNCGGWCIWKDRATPDYKTEIFTAEFHRKTNIDATFA